MWLVGINLLRRGTDIEASLKSDFDATREAFAQQKPPSRLNARAVVRPRHILYGDVLYRERGAPRMKTNRRRAPAGGVYSFHAASRRRASRALCRLLIIRITDSDRDHKPDVHGMAVLGDSDLMKSVENLQDALRRWGDL